MSPTPTGEAAAMTGGAARTGNEAARTAGGAAEDREPEHEREPDGDEGSHRLECLPPRRP